MRTRELASARSRLRIVEGLGGPAELDTIVDQFGVVIDGAGTLPR